MEEVGHEGDLGDGQPEVPGEEVVDDAPISPTAGEGDPGQTETPAYIHFLTLKAKSSVKDTLNQCNGFQFR